MTFSWIIRYSDIPLCSVYAQICVISYSLSRLITQTRTHCSAMRLTVTRGGCWLCVLGKPTGGDRQRRVRCANLSVSYISPSLGLCCVTQNSRSVCCCLLTACAAQHSTVYLSAWLVVILYESSVVTDKGVSVSSQILAGFISMFCCCT